MISLLRRAIRWILAISAAAIVLWSFYWVATRSARERQVAVGQVELRVLHWGDKNEDAIVAGLVDDFLAMPENRDIRILRMNLGQSAAVNTKLQTMLAAGDPPDVFYLGFEKVADFASKGLLADVETLIREDEAAGRPSVDLQDFFPAVLDAFRWDEQRQRIGSGNLIGLPKDFTTVGFYYNRDLFRRAGLLDPPKDAWTWDEFIDAARSIGQLPDCYGADFATWEAQVRIFLWTHGLDFADPDFQEYYFNDPNVQARLAMLQGWFHHEDRTLVSAKTQLETGLEPFLAGNVGMAGPFGRWKVPTYRLIEKFDWDFAPLPHAAGTAPRNGVFTVAWAIADGSRHKQEAWRFVKYLTGSRGQELMCRSGLAIPVLKSVAESPAFSDPTQKPENFKPLLDAADVARPIDWPADPKYLHQLRVRLEDIFKLNRPVAEALSRVDTEWRENRESSALNQNYPRMPWLRVGWLLSVPIAVALLIGGYLWWRGRPSRMALAEETAGLAMIGPWVIGFLAFTAFPVVVSLLLTFTQWSGLATLDQARWVGWDNLKQLIFFDKTFHRVLAVTAWYALLAVPSSQIVALLAAALMNVEVRGIGVFRAIWYLPSVLAGVGMAVMWKWVFHHEHGLLKMLLDPWLQALGTATPAFFEKDAATWGVPAFALINLWTIGGTMMVYLAGLKGIPGELYEAAHIDGASSWRRFVNVTLPMLSPVIFFNVIIAIINSFQTFTQAHVMTAGGPGDSTRFYVVYLYNQGFDFHEMGYASAMAWLLLLIVLAFTLIIMRGSRQWVYYEGLKG